VLKIDRSFVSAMAESSEGAAVVHALVELGKDLHLETVAEGIETEVQRRQVEAEGIDTGQGFLISRPIDVAAVNKLLRVSVTIGPRDRPDHLDELDEPDEPGGPDELCRDLAQIGSTPLPV